MEYAMVSYNLKQGPNDTYGCPTWVCHVFTDQHDEAVASFTGTTERHALGKGTSFVADFEESLV